MTYAHIAALSDGDSVSRAVAEHLIAGRDFTLPPAAGTLPPGCVILAGDLRIERRVTDDTPVWVGDDGRTFGDTHVDLLLVRGAELHGPAIPGHNEATCDACLYDLHACRVCRDVVGHGHEHDDPTGATE